MADTQRTRAAILALFADNTTGQIGAQDDRDFIVTIMNEEFKFAGDFWAQPDKVNMTVEGVRGWLLYSQAADSAFSFGQIGYLTVSGTWKTADAADVDENCLMALAGEDIAVDGSGVFLREGLVFHSTHSGNFSGYIGRPVYLESGINGSIVGPGSAAPTNKKIIGVVEDDDKTVWRFKADWSVVGA